MSDDARPNPIPAISSYLQERLQQERQDGVRNSPRTSTGRNTPTGGFRDEDVGSSSPLRRSTTATGRRPRSASGDEADSQKGYGAKEMEKVRNAPFSCHLNATGGVYDTNNLTMQTLSTLHKQNFDLKVELYHRRERQNALEQRVATLQRDQAELMELNENVWSELNERDVALKEAIGLIIGLEKRVGELLLEREMVRQVEADGTYRHSRNDESDLEEPAASTPKAERFPGALDVDDDKVLDRMPSFMSERSEHTENLRNVILNNKSSIFHLRKVSQSSVDPSELARITSPSLSVLSESSFTSVYGGGKDNLLASPQPHPLDFSDDKTEDLPAPAKQPSWECQRSGSASRTGNGTFKSSVGFPSPLQSLSTLVDMPSPLQQLERLESRLASGQMRRPSIASRGSSNSIKNSPSARHSQAAAQIKTKQEKREALRRVMTSTPTEKDLAASRALPPTPDTVSTNTLRRFHNSNDTLSYDHRSTPQTSVFDARSKASSGQYSLASSVDGRGGNASSQTSQPASTTAFTSRREEPPQQVSANRFANHGQYAHLLPPRPYSACETTSSRARADDWSSDSEDSDGGAEAYSEDDDSDFDYWMREGSKGEDGNLGMPPQSRKAGGRPEPDLFSFPDGGWKTEAVFGEMERSGLVRSPAAGLKRESVDAPSTSMTYSEDGTFQAPAPDEKEGGITPPTRRSSLHARTGSMSASSGVITPSSTGKLRKNPVRKTSYGKGAGRVRSSSIDSSVSAPRLQQQQPGQAGALPASKRSQYPPIAGQPQPTRSRAFSGLNGLFRRGAAVDDQQQQQPVEPSPRPSKPSGRMSVPPPPARPWAFRPPDAMEDDLTSATPPPIQRNRAPPPISTLGIAEVEEVGTPMTDGSDTVPNTPQSVNRRSKWLGLGRMGGLKKNVA
ncbi:hypothetical protein PG996_004693 [Apiospora saccharicola]|uniref:Centrosomin N-terminal motif 1 domain-containing protein n=1 Tax=Apiospora saccharicola TaxID=335842 RepID=A0ABR1W4T6_9PEZI